MDGVAAGAARGGFAHDTGEGGISPYHLAHGGDLRDRIKIGASGKVANGIDIIKRLIQGADFTLAARAMMFAVGCIQAQRCHTNRCPVGVTTQDTRRARALNVPDKTTRVYNLQRSTVASAQQILASMGLDDFCDLDPSMLNRRIQGHRTTTYADLHEWLQPGALLAEDPPTSWLRDWTNADSSRFEGGSRDHRASRGFHSSGQGAGGHV